MAAVKISPSSCFLTKYTLLSYCPIHLHLQVYGWIKQFNMNSNMSSIFLKFYELKQTGPGLLVQFNFHNIPTSTTTTQVISRDQSWIKISPRQSPIDILILSWLASNQCPDSQPAQHWSGVYNDGKLSIFCNKLLLLYASYLASSSDSHDSKSKYMGSGR